jgi:hypothetical protein
VHSVWWLLTTKLWKSFGPIFFYFCSSFVMKYKGPTYGRACFIFFGFESDLGSRNGLCTLPSLLQGSFCLR